MLRRSSYFQCVYGSVAVKLPGDKCDIIRTARRRRRVAFLYWTRVRLLFAWGRTSHVTASAAAVSLQRARFVCGPPATAMRISQSAHDARILLFGHSCHVTRDTDTRRRRHRSERRREIRRRLASDFAKRPRFRRGAGVKSSAGKISIMQPELLKSSRMLRRQVQLAR